MKLALSLLLLFSIAVHFAASTTGVMSSYYFNAGTTDNPTCGNPQLARIYSTYNVCQAVNIGRQPNCSVYYNCLRAAGTTFSSYQSCLTGSEIVYAFISPNATAGGSFCYNVDIYDDAACTIANPYVSRLQVTFGCHSVDARDYAGNDCHLSQTINPTIILSASALSSFFF